MWLTGLAWDIVGDGDMPGDVRTLLARMMDPDVESDSDDEGLLGFSSDGEEGPEERGGAGAAGR